MGSFVAVSGLSSSVSSLHRLCLFRRRKQQQPPPPPQPRTRNAWNQRGVAARVALIALFLLTTLYGCLHLVQLAWWSKQAPSSPPSWLLLDPNRMTTTSTKTRRRRHRRHSHHSSANTTRSRECRDRNHRGIFQVHKMGVLLLHDLAKHAFPEPVPTYQLMAASLAGPQTRQRQRQRRPGEMWTAGIHSNNSSSSSSSSSSSNRPDDRYVLVTRNFYTAIVSGYLYHKRHFECELNHWGKPSLFQREWLLKENWEERIRARLSLQSSNGTSSSSSNTTNQSSTTTTTTTPSRFIPSWPPGKGRNLCQYLSDESERDGLRVYMEWAKTMYFDPLLDFVNNQNQNPTTIKNTSTLLLVCFEDLVRDLNATVQRMTQWLFPPLRNTSTTTTTRSINSSLACDNTPPPPPPLATAVSSSPRHTTHPTTTMTAVSASRRADQSPSRAKIRAHGTTHDPVIRQRLVPMVHELDQQLFQGALGTLGRETFGCE